MKDGKPNLLVFERPKINVSEGDLPTLTKAAWDALRQRNNPLFLFNYGESPHRLEDDDAGRKTLKLLRIDGLRHEVARAADWIRVVPRLGIVPTFPPIGVIKDMLATPYMPLPPLQRLSEIPVFAPTGTLVSQPGYHRASQTYYAPAKNLVIPEVPPMPIEKDISRALSLILEELLFDFPFVNKSDQAHAVALFLLPFARPLIDGLTPNHLIDSPTPGTGKGLLADVLLGSSVGRDRMAVMAQAASGEEWRKRITASLRQAPEVILIDNITIRLDSGELASALTAPLWQDRLLGVSQIIVLPVRCVWVTTGNNPFLSAELTRRTIRIRLDRKVERPWEYRGFKHPDLKVWAYKHRGEVVWSGLTLVQNWLAAGSPYFTGRTLGSYEEWAGVMGGILGTSGIEGFLGNLDEFYEASDAETQSGRCSWRNGSRSLGQRRYK